MTGSSCPCAKTAFPWPDWKHGGHMSTLTHKWGNIVACRGVGMVTAVTLCTLWAVRKEDTFPTRVWGQGHGHRKGLNLVHTVDALNQVSMSLKRCLSAQHADCSFCLNFNFIAPHHPQHFHLLIAWAQESCLPSRPQCAHRRRACRLAWPSSMACAQGWRTGVLLEGQLACT